MKRAQRGPQNAPKKEPEMKMTLDLFLLSPADLSYMNDVRYMPHKFLGKRVTTLGNILSLITVGKHKNMYTKFKRLLVA